MKSRMLLIAVLAMFAGGGSPALGQQAGTGVNTTLTLEQAIDIALRNNRTAKNAQLETEKADEKLAATRTRRLPAFKVTGLFSQPLTTFDTTFEKGVFGTFAGIGPIPAENTVITSSSKPTGIFIAQLQQPLSQLRRLNLQVKQMEAGREISEAQLRARQQAIVNDVKRAYYAILQTQSSAAAAAEATKLYRELDRVTGEYVMQQVALKTDRMSVQTNLAKAEYEELTLNNLLTSQKEQLNNLLGRDVRLDFTLSEAADTAQVMMRETDLAQARARALQQRPELQEARLRVEQAKLDRRAKKSEFIPDVSLTVNYVSTFSSSNFIPRSVSGVGVQVEWEPFDWGRRKRELGEKDRIISQADNTLLDTQSQVLMDVNNRYRRVQETCQLIRIARLAQTAARANVQLAANKYRLDAVLLKDVLQAQTSLAESNYEYQKALLSFWTAKADFEKALGEDK